MSELFWRRRFCRCENKKMINPRSKQSPMMDPMTMPAMAPPLRPLPAPPLGEPVPVAPAVGEEVAVAVDVNVTAIDEKTGKVTSRHRSSVFDVKQQESVAFSVLARQ